MKVLRLEYQGVILLWSSAFFVLLFLLLTAFQYSTQERLAERLRIELLNNNDRWPSSVSDFYRARDFEPLWLEQGKLTSIGIELLAELENASLEGLLPHEYLNEALLSKILQLAAAEHLQDSTSYVFIELALTDSFLRYGDHLLRGRIDPNELHDYWTISTRSFTLDALMLGLSESSLSSVTDQLKPAHRAYAGLRNTLSTYRDIAARGGWPAIAAGPYLKRGDVDERISSLRRRLKITFDLPHANSDTSSRYDESLERAVKAFQHRHDMQITGHVDDDTRKVLNVSVTDRIDQIILNMERWRWMPGDFGQRNVRVNLPDYSLTAFERGIDQFSMNVITGKPSTPTPLFHAQISQVVVSPYWYVPSSIATMEILPKLRQDSAYLSRYQMEVRLRGQTIESDTIQWGEISPEDFPYILRQKPGSMNALGKLRFTMPNTMNIGMHDTNEPYLFDKEMRAFSHGCIRLEDPIKLAKFVLNDTSWTDEHLKEIIEYNVELPIQVHESVPVYILYWSAWVDHKGRVHFRDDVYGHDRRLQKAWENYKVLFNIYQELP